MVTARKRYDTLSAGRSEFLRRAREVSKLTIPSLIPEEGNTSSANYPTPYQSIGSRGVNNLAAKLLTSLFPPNEPFFRLTVDDFDLADIANDPEKRGQVEKALAAIERSALMEVESRAFRVPLYEALRHLIVGGNTLLFQPPRTGAVKVYPLSRYVIARDPLGTLLEVVIKETIAIINIPEDLRTFLDISIEEGEDPSTKTVDRFTRVMMQDGKYVLFQEMNDKIVPDSTTTYELDRLPFLALRFVRVEGEDYGRGFAEEYIGDLKSTEALTMSVVEAAAASARILFLVNPNSTTSVQALEETPNLGFCEGTEQDITTLKVDKSADMQPALHLLEKLEQRLSQAFMMHSSAQRAGERVTAEEIRFMVAEIDNSMGGVYSLLSQELQLPVVAQLLREMEETGKMPKFPKDVLKPQVVTGVEAIGRDLDMSKMERFLQSLQAVGEIAYNHINWPDVIDRLAAGSGLDTQGLVKSAEQVQQEQQAQQQEAQQAQMMDIAGKAAPAVAKGMME